MWRIFFFFFFFVKRPFRQLSLYTAITRASAAENYLQKVALLKNDPHNEQ